MRQHNHRGGAMDSNRRIEECRLFLPKGPFDIAASASEEELLNIAVQYAVDSQGHWDHPISPRRIALNAAGEAEEEGSLRLRTSNSGGQRTSPSRSHLR